MQHDTKRNEMHGLLFAGTSPSQGHRQVIRVLRGDAVRFLQCRFGVFGFRVRAVRARAAVVYVACEMMFGLHIYDE